MPTVTSANACKILTERITECLNLKDKKLTLNDITLNDIKWKDTVEPMLKNESEDAQNKMDALKQTFLSNDNIIRKLSNVENAIKENLEYSRSWARWDAFNSTFFGTGTPTLWKKCLEAVKVARTKVVDRKIQEANELQKELENSLKCIVQLKSELNEPKAVKGIEKEITQTLKDVKQIDKVTLQKGKEVNFEKLKEQQEKLEEKVEEIQNQTENQKTLRSSSAPILTGSPLPPPPPPPPISSVPTVKNSEIKNIQKLIQDFKKDVDENKLIEKDSEAKKLISEDKDESEVIKTIREKRIKAIKEEAKKASKKYFGEGSPISKSILEKPDIKKIIYKTSKRNKGKMKEFLWPILMCQPSNYEILVKNLKQWRGKVKELKEDNKTLYAKATAYGSDVMKKDEKEKYSSLVDEIKKNREVFVNKLIDMQKNGSKIYQGLKTYTGKNKPINIKPTKKWYKGKNNLKWVEAYIEKKDKDDFELLKGVLSSEINKIVNLRILIELRESYEKIYSDYKKLVYTHNKTKQEQKKFERFETNKSALDKTSEELDKKLKEYTTDAKWKLTLIEDDGIYKEWERISSIKNEKEYEEWKFNFIKNEKGYEEWKSKLTKKENELNKIKILLTQAKDQSSLDNLFQQILGGSTNLVKNGSEILKGIMNRTHKYEKVEPIDTDKFKI